MNIVRASVWMIVFLIGSMSSHAVTTIVSDNYNVTGSGTGFDLNAGINSGINPPTTRLGGSAKANLRYINTGTKATNAYSISGNELQVTSAVNPGRFVLSADGTTSFDFSSALGIATASPSNPVIYDLAITMNNASSGTQRFSFALSTAEGDATTWDFGVQLYRANSTDTFYTLGKRIDTGSSGVATDLNSAITTLTGNTFGNDIMVLIRVTDAGSETSTFSSRVQVSLNAGNTWIYDTATDTDLPNGWRFNGPGRHIMWDIAGGAAVAYDSFSLKLNPTLSTANTSSVVRAMTYNIHSAVGPDNKVNTQRIANFIISQNVDLVSLNEVARFMPRADGRDTIGELAQETGMTFVFSNNNTALTGNDQFGNAILSKFPVLSRDHRLLPNINGNEQRGWLKAVVDVNGKFLSFWVTHLDFHADNTERLMCGTNFNQWIGDETLPVFFCGDFNDTPNTPIYDLMQQKWIDIWPTAGDGSLGRTVPCPPDPVDGLRARIDYIWKAKGAGIVPTNASVGYALEASDHYCVVAQFSVSNFTNHSPAFYLPLNEGTGTKVTDTIGGLIGTFGTNAPVWSTNSATGLAGDSSLYFDGTKQLTIADPNQIIGTNGINGDYTLEAWVQLPVNYAPAQRAILFQYERRPGFSFSINTNRTLHTTTFKIKDIPSTAAIPNDGRWHHVAVVHTDGVNMKFYIDATLAATVSYTNGAGFRTDSVLTVGSDSEGANRFTGYIDRIRFEQRALTVNELDFHVPNFKVLSATRQPNGQFNLTWESVGATRYRIQYTTDLNQPFTDIVRSASAETDPAPAGLGSTMSFTDVSAGTTSTFYRVKVVP
jgi:endonuclease/exonuclease/phosphatase family metal-dependent hydrolase